MSKSKYKYIKKNADHCRPERKPKSGGWFGAAASGVMIVVIMGLLGIYISEVNGNTANGYKLQELERAKKQLIEQVQKLEVAKIELGQIARIEQAAMDMGMSKCENGGVEYLAVARNEVAKR